jgi:hypothetical protein
MIQVYIELTNIVWEDDQDGSIAYEQGTCRSFVAEAIADSLEHHTGHRPKSWVLYCFDDTLETA